MARTGRPRTFDLPIEEIRELTAQGWRMGALAKRYGCSTDVVMKRMIEADIPRHPKHSNPGALNPAWKGGRYFDDDGYILVFAPDHPYATKDRRVREHRLIMEQQLGRYLLPTEVVDHIDGNKANNDPSNLRLFERNADHLRATLKGRVPNWTPDGFERMREAGRKPKPPISEETRAKMRASQSTRPRGPLSEETKEKIRQAHLRLGPRPKHTPETIEKMRQSALLREARKRVAKSV